jgi:hypothetical protein
MQRMIRYAKTRRRACILLAVVAVPVLAYFAFFFSFTLNVPYWDDYAVLAFAINFTNPEWPGKTALFFSQHNEHRIVTLRALALGFRALALEINWKVIAFLGNLGLLGIVLLLWKWAGRTSEGGPPLLRSLAFAPIVFILFQPQHYELMLWAMCAFTNVGAAFFAFLSFSFLTRPERTGIRPAPAMTAALGAALLSVFTNGNGLFVLPIGALVLLAAKKLGRLAAWLGTSVLAAGFYFLGYARNPVHPEVAPFLKGHPFEVARYFLSTLGSAADFGVFRPHAAIAAGIAILAVFAMLAWKRIDRKEPFLASSILFVLLSLAGQALTRAPYGVVQSLESRYKFLSALAAGLAYLGWLKLGQPGKRSVIAAIAISSVFGTGAFFANLPRGRETRAARLSNIADWNKGKAALMYANAEHADAIMRLAVKRKIYEPPREWNIDRPEYPFGALTPGSSAGSGSETGKIFVSGWALDDTGPPDIIVRRGRLPSDPPEMINSENQVFLDKVECRDGAVPPYDLIYYGFPGRRRMIWGYATERGGTQSGPAPATLYFFARDKDGHESLLGERSIGAAPAARPAGAARPRGTEH